MTDKQQKPRGLVIKLLFGLLGFGAFYLLGHWFLPVFLAIGMSFLLYPIVDRLERLKIKGRAFPNTLAVLIASCCSGCSCMRRPMC